MNRFKKRVKDILFIIFVLPGTLLHELLHAFGTFISGGNIKSFSLWPHFNEDGSITLGAVVSAHRYKWAFVITSIAPLFSWVLLYFFVTRFVLPVFDFSNFELFQFLKMFFSMDMLLYLYISYLLFMAGILSRQDIKVFFWGLFSISGMIFLLSTILAVYLYIYIDFSSF